MSYPSTPDLFPSPDQIALGPSAVLLRRFAAPNIDALLGALWMVVRDAPFRHMITPGGHTMSVAMTNCGQVGWVTDRSGYRYDPTDPASGQPWPELPTPFRALAQTAAKAAGFDAFNPDACLINRYVPGSRLTLHQDKNESDFDAPIVSVSLGLSAKFIFGGLKRNDKVQRVMLDHGDVAIWGGSSRLVYHGVDALKDGLHPVTGRCRINLTFRKAL